MIREPLSAPAAGDIAQARERIAGSVTRTPLVRLDADVPFTVRIKLENLQPIGSFKLRGALNAMRALPAERLARGVYTASAGNMAQGVAWGARELGVPCTVIVPDRAPQAKVDAVSRLGARVVRLPYDRWWQVLVDHGYEGIDGEFIHPVSDPRVLAGNATIGAEIMEDAPAVSRIYVPYGGGGLAAGIASGVASRDTAETREAPDPGGGPPRVYACEVTTAAPFRASLEAGEPRSIEHTPSFVDGIGGRSVLAEMWPVASSLLAGSIVVGVAEVAAAVRLLVRRGRVVAEGAGATALAAALSQADRIAAGETVVVVVSGGNIDPAVLADILTGKL